MNAWLPRAARSAAVLAMLALAACSSAPKKHDAAAAGRPVAGKAARSGASVGAAGRCTGASPYAPAKEDPSTRGDYTAGGLYKPGVRDSTPDHVPDVACIPEPAVTAEPRSALGNRSPYSVLGKTYYVLDRPRGYVEQGTASYYGAKFHGRLTSNHEVYDMYAFSAAHKTLPLPSFARVTNLDNGQSVIVRVNDRGPFHDGRVIDLSYAAAVKLDIVARGTGRVEVRALTPGDPDIPVLASAPAAVPPAASSRRDSRPAMPVAASGPAPAITSPAPATGLDHLVQALPPVAAATVALPPPAVAERSIPLPAVATAAAAPLDIAPAVVAATTAVAAGPVLQVASFSSQDNARKALDRLLAAGIAGARLDDVVAGGRTLWRLRVAPGSADALELAGRIAGLGFGTPQLVRD